jgi:regulatory protein
LLKGGGPDSRKNNPPRFLVLIMKKSAQDYVLFLLSRRDYTVAEVRERLKRKGYDESDGESVVRSLCEKKLLDDERFARTYSEMHRSWGKIKIKFGLIKKGVPEDIIEATLNGEDSESELEKAKEAAGLWIKKNQNIPKEKIYNRLGGYLSRQGYQWEVAKEILGEVLEKRG